MKIIPLLSAIIVSAIMYLVIMERELVMSYLPERAAPEAVEEAPEEVAEAVVQEGPRAVQVVAMRSTRQAVQSGIVLRGQTEAIRKLNVAAETTGQVISDPLRKGHVVEACEVLCRLDPGTREADLAQARAALAETEANDTSAAARAERGLTAQNSAISRRAQLEAAIARVQSAEREIERLTITAPFDGVLETDTAEIGTLLQPGAICATILDLNRINLVGFASERDVGRIEVGAQAGGRLISGEQIMGEVAFVGRSADPQTRTFRVEVVADNADGRLRDGATAEILISLAGVEAHLVPQSALTLDDEGALGVRIAVDDMAQFVPVSIIRDDASGAWVTGLPETADIITVGQEFVSDGREIAVTLQDAGATR